MPRHYAQGTSVSVQRSRAQIEKLLRDWGAESMHWSDQLRDPIGHTLRFVWKHKEAYITARYDLTMDVERLKKRAIDGRTNQVSERKLDKLKERWSQESHRALLIMLTANFNFVDQGFVRVEKLFLPWLENNKGEVIGDILADHLVALSHLDSRRLISAKSEGE